MSHQLRRPFRAVHIWIGLSFGLIFSLYSLTGSVLIFRAEIDRASQPRWISKESARPASPMDAGGVNILKQWPGSRITRVSFDPAPGSPIEAQVRTAAGDNLRVFVSRQTGEVLGTFRLPWLEQLTDLHHNLLLGATGRSLTGIIGFALFFTSLSGLLIYLFRKPRLRDALQIRLKGSRNRLNLDLHRAAGIASYLGILAVSVTGIALAYPGLLGQKPAMVKAGEKVKPLALSTYAAAALESMPSAQLREIRMGRAGSQGVTVVVWTPGDFRPDGSTRILMDTRTARVLAVDMGRKPSQALATIHYADWGGLPLKIVWSFVGLIPSLMFGSGFILWWGPYRARRKLKSKPDLHLASAIR